MLNAPPLFPLSLSLSFLHPSMEVNLCLNHHHRALRLTSSPLSLSSIPSTQFLGSAHSLRPPSSASVSSLRSSRNKRRSRLGLLRLHSPRFVFKASFHSHSLIVVVVVVTLSAVSLLHFTLNRRKKTPLNQVNPFFLFSFSCRLP